MGIATLELLGIQGLEYLEHSELFRQDKYLHIMG